MKSTLLAFAAFFLSSGAIASDTSEVWICRAYGSPLHQDEQTFWGGGETQGEASEEARRHCEPHRAGARGACSDQGCWKTSKLIFKCETSRKDPRDPFVGYGETLEDAKYRSYTLCKGNGWGTRAHCDENLRCTEFNSVVKIPSRKGTSPAGGSKSGLTPAK